MATPATSRRRALLALFLAICELPCLIEGHGYVAMPPLRGGVAGNADNGYCPHCGNGAGVCGDGGQWPANSDFLNYGASVVTNLQSGSVLEIEIRITAHHKGHFEFAICDQHVSGDLADPQACFDAGKLHRADRPSDCQPNDARGDCQPIQADYPERWYLPPGIGTYKMRFKIPADLACASCTLQWRWWTANSCVPAPNYGCFFQQLAAEGWDASAWCGSFCGTCGAYEAGHYNCGEQFRNCADVAVLGGAGESTEVSTSAPASSTTTTVSQTAATTAPPTTPPGAGSCVWNRDCAVSAWCENAAYETWCPLNEASCPSPWCTRAAGTTPAPSPPASSATTASTAPATPAPTGEVCAWNRDCAVSAWCNNAAYETWCPQNAQSCPSPHCVRTGATAEPTTTTTTTTTTTPATSTATSQTASPSTSTFLGQTTTTTTAAPPTTTTTTTTSTTTRASGGPTCVSQELLECINDASTYWPRCSPRQTKANGGPAGYEFGLYCTEQWTQALNEMLYDPLVGKCDNVTAIHTLLAQIAYETGYYSTLYQPLDGGAGLIHMIPQNWPINVGHMDELWPGMDYISKLGVLQEEFFQTPEYSWRSVAAWYLRTNHVIPGCEGKNLFDLDMDAQTQCILASINDRSEAFNIVGQCLSTVSTSSAAESSPAAATSVASTPSPVDCSPIGDCGQLGFCDQPSFQAFCEQSGQQGSCPAPFCTQVL